MRLQVILVALSAFVGVVLAQSQAYGQCGGTGWTGPTTCAEYYTCVKSNNYYSQCISGSPSSTATISTGNGAPASISASAPNQTKAPIPNIPQVWKDAWTKAQADVAKMSLEDKVNMGTGIGTDKGNCVGNTPAIESINFPGLCLQDSPLGVRYADLVSAFPPAINVAATFNRTLMRRRGIALGEEFHGKGVHVALGPMMNMARSPAAGRNWEGFGGDPYLSGEGAYETVMGVQSTGVQACAKHYINNEQEHFRETSSSNVDDRYAGKQHEIYAAPFLRAVQANVASVMCSYNQINGSFACENDKTLNGIMKEEFGFQGCEKDIMSDWWATHSTTAVNFGLDMTMPGDTSFNSSVSYFGSALVNAVNSGQVSIDRMDDLATRILASWYLLGQDSGYPEVNFDSWDLSAPVNKHVNVQGDHASLIRTIGAASTVLLKNTGGALPLKPVKTIAIVGNDAGANPQGPNGFMDRAGDSGVLAMGWGSGTDDFPYLITPLDAIADRSGADGTVVSSSTSDTDLGAASRTATEKDVALVFITADSGEGYLTVEGNAGDRNDLSAWHSGDALIAQVAGVNDNTIVVVNSVGAIDMEAWIDHPNVTAVVWSGLPGQEAGNALADVLYGDYNPSGRLPYTIGKSINDYSAHIITSGGSIVQVPYTEGLMVDYRHFDAVDIAPRFEFGFGLSYTTFDYSDLDVSGSIGDGSPPSGPGSALDPWLHEVVFTVSFTLTNNGSLAGHESPQLYTSPPKSAASAPYNLKGFDNVFLAPEDSTTVSFNLSRYDLSVWNVVMQRWEVPTGTTGVSVGASSRDLRLTGSIDN